MAGIQLISPEPFNFKTPDNWPRWRRCFKQFCVASGLAEGAAEKQITMLLYCLGEQSKSVLVSTKPTEEECTDYVKVLEKFDVFFEVHKSVIFERARFNRNCGAVHHGTLQPRSQLQVGCNGGRPYPQSARRDPRFSPIRTPTCTARPGLGPEESKEVHLPTEVGPQTTDCPQRNECSHSGGKLFQWQVEKARVRPATTGELWTHCIWQGEADKQTMYLMQKTAAST